MSIVKRIRRWRGWWLNYTKHHGRSLADRPVQKKNRRSTVPQTSVDAVLVPWCQSDWARTEPLNILTRDMKHYSMPQWIMKLLRSLLTSKKGGLHGAKDLGGEETDHLQGGETRHELKLSTRARGAIPGPCGGRLRRDLGNPGGPRRTVRRRGPKRMPIEPPPACGPSHLVQAAGKGGLRALAGGRVLS